MFEGRHRLIAIWRSFVRIQTMFHLCFSLFERAAENYSAAGAGNGRIGHARGRGRGFRCTITRSTPSGKEIRDAPVNLELTEEQKLLQRSVREFAEAEVKPVAKELDETGRFPLEIFRKAGELGLTGVCIPEKYGGAGMDHICYSIVIEEIARVCASTSVILSVQNSLYCATIEHYGTEDQKQKFLVPFARGEKIGCYALTEPQAGSNAAALSTKAVRKGDRYVVNGAKAWITNGGVADAGIIYVNTQPEKGEKGITALIVEKGTPGFAVGKEEKKLGIHATACAGLSFGDCEVPVANRIGEEGQGYKIALSMLDGGRIGIASQATGIAQGAFEAALRLRSRAPGLRPSDRRISGDPIHARGHGHRNRRGAIAGAARGVEAGFGRALLHGGGHREAFRQRNGHARGAQSDPDSRRQWLQPRISRRARLPRRAHHRNLRRHERNSKAGHRILGAEIDRGLSTPVRA